MGRFIFITSNDRLILSDAGIKGNIHYKINDASYKITTVIPFEEKIKKICLLVVKKNKYAVGLEYTYCENSAPVVVFKTINTKETFSLCEKNDIKIIYDDTFAAVLYEHGEIDEIIPTELWENTAKLLARIMKGDKKFLKKIKFK